MNISIKLNSIEIIHRVIHYTRTLDICSGIGTLAVDTDYETAMTINPWNEIEVYEDGIKVGLFYVIDFSKAATTGVRTITAQDGSKRLEDFFVPDVYTLSYPTMTRYWIEKFLNDAGVTYSINAIGNGQVLSENSSLGPSSAYDLIMGLLQQSGWYMYFDGNGVCQIGDLTKDLSDPMENLTDDIILSLQVKKSDKSLRNRAVVWGNYSNGSWAFADISTKTGYETSANDDRPVVLANSTIYSSGIAATLAKKLLNEFDDISVEKIIEVAGYYDLSVGDVVNVDSEYYSGSGLITNYQVDASSGSGVITTITLDVKCPRLFAYYGFITWVYTGTDGQGVWRKRLDSAIWEDFSTGLTNLVVTDLIIKNSVFACITDDGCYVNLSHYVANWKKYDQGTLTDINGVQYTSTKTKAVKVDIDDATNDISIGYELTELEKGILGENRTWTVIITPKRIKKIEYPISISTTGVTDLNLIDVEKYVGKDLVSVTTPSGLQDPTLDSFWGKRQVKFFTATDPDSVTMTTDSNGATYSGSDVQYAGRYIDDTDSSYIAHMVHGRTNYIFARNEFTQVVWSGDTKYQIDVPIAGIVDPTPPDLVNSLACYWLNEEDRNGNERDYDDREYYLLALYGDGTNQKIEAKSFTPVLSGYPYELSNTVAVSTSNITLATLLTIDGVSLNINDRVLVTAQTDPAENGTYLAAMGAWSRTADTLGRCATITVTGGTLYSNTVWQVANTEPIILDTSGITIQRVLIPTTRIASTQIVDINTDFDYGGAHNLIDSFNLEIPPRLVDGVYYYFYRGKNYISDDSYTEEFYVYKYDCETNSTSNSMAYSWEGPGKRYGGTEPTSRFQSEMSVPCDLGAAYTALQYFQPGYDSTIPNDPVYVPAGYTTVVVIKASRTSNTYNIDKVTDPHTFGTIHGTDFDEYCYSYSEVDVYYARYQGCRIVNGKYHPYIKYVRSITEFDDREGETCFSFTPGVTLPTRISVETISYGIYDLYDFSTISYTYTLKTTAWDGAEITTTYMGETSFLESADYIDNLPLYTKSLSYPVYMHIGKEIRNGATSNTIITTLGSTSRVVSLSMDDFDDSIYIYRSTPTRRVEKTSLAGTVLSTMGISTAPPATTSALTVANGQIYLGRYSSTFYDLETDRLDIYKLADSILHRPSSGRSYILERNPSNTFDIIDTDVYKLNLESSINWPLISRTYDGAIGTPTGHHFRIYNTYPGYVEGSDQLLDARITNIGGNFLGVSGEVSQNKYGLVIPSGGSLYLASNSNANNRTLIYTYSGAIVTETSNNYFPQYIFVASLSGFMQRFPIDNSAFVDHSSGMPVSRINIIRLDDRV